MTWGNQRHEDKSIINLGAKRKNNYQCDPLLNKVTQSGRVVLLSQTTESESNFNLAHESLRHPEFFSTLTTDFLHYSINQSISDFAYFSLCIETRGQHR